MFEREHKWKHGSISPSFIGRVRELNLNSVRFDYLIQRSGFIDFSNLPPLFRNFINNIISPFYSNYFIFFHKIWFCSLPNFIIFHLLNCMSLVQGINDPLLIKLKFIELKSLNFDNYFSGLLILQMFFCLLVYHVII